MICLRKTALPHPLCVVAEVHQAVPVIDLHIQFPKQAESQNAGDLRSTVLADPRQSNAVTSSPSCMKCPNAMRTLSAVYTSFTLPFNPLITLSSECTLVYSRATLVDNKLS